TGLLEREAREAIEAGFKEQARADDANLLAATPTLEMGIDIGDLSATLACAVPPSTANYLQRIGRAGRKTGNSLVLALANVRPHDLYFFAEPLDMLAGAITPPGCFLDAPNMLRRQFLAFCIDTWTATDPQAKNLPRTVRDMLTRLKRGGFPGNLLTLYQVHKADLMERFLALFGAVVS
ncbi:MAG: helicase, partial [Delftia sp.]|nr:helicase [Delftia sp.]